MEHDIPKITLTFTEEDTPDGRAEIEGKLRSLRRAGEMESTYWDIYNRIRGFLKHTDEENEATKVLEGIRSLVWPYVSDE